MALPAVLDECVLPELDLDGRLVYSTDACVGVLCARGAGLGPRGGTRACHHAEPGHCAGATWRVRLTNSRGGP